jgi:hypothetical protein
MNGMVPAGRHWLAAAAAAVAVAQENANVWCHIMIHDVYMVNVREPYIKVY